MTRLKYRQREVGGMAPPAKPPTRVGKDGDMREGTGTSPKIAEMIEAGYRVLLAERVEDVPSPLDTFLVAEHDGQYIVVADSGDDGVLTIIVPGDIAPRGLMLASRNWWKTEIRGPSAVSAAHNVAWWEAEYCKADTSRQWEIVSEAFASEIGCQTCARQCALARSGAGQMPCAREEPNGFLLYESVSPRWLRVSGE